MSFFKKITQFGAPGLFRSMRGGGGSPNFQQGPNPADQAMPYLDQIPAEVGRYYEPYIQGGREAENISNPIYQRMAQGPGAFIEQLMQGYTPSRGYQFKQREMQQAMQNAAAHGGFLGTPYNQQQQAELTQGLLSQDMQQFLSNLLGVQGAGLQGQEGRAERGYKAGLGYGDILGSNLGAKSGLAFQGQAGQNQLAADAFSQRMNNDMARRNSRMGFLSNLLGLGTSAFTGGFRPMGGGY